MKLRFRDKDTTVERHTGIAVSPLSTIHIEIPYYLNEQMCLGTPVCC